MIEVFKTDVRDSDQANKLIDQIHNVFNDYRANFDLDDCDKILRVECTTRRIESSLLIEFLKSSGSEAEILPDDLPIDKEENEKSFSVQSIISGK